MKNLLKHIVLILGVLVVQSSWSQNLSIDDMVKGKIRVKLKREILNEVTTTKSATLGTSDTNWGISALDNVNQQVGITRIQRVFPFSIKHEQKHRKHDLHLWFELDFDAGLDPREVTEYYKVLDNVDIVKPLYKKVQLGAKDKPVEVKIDTIFTNNRNTGLAAAQLKSAVATSFDDPRLPEQWHYENDGTIGTENKDIDLTQAWDKATGSSNIVVAIVDGGIDTEHEDLKDNLWVNEIEAAGEQGVDDDNNGYVDDIHGYNFVFGGAVTAHFHGTHVAGTVGAVSNNGIGVAGIAGGDGTEGSGVRMMSCQIYDTRSSNGGNFAAALVYGADNGAVISQNSWGYTTPGFYEPEVLDAIDYFIEEAGNYEGSPMTGGIVIFASGNTGREEEHYPAAYDKTLAVASIGPGGENAPYSTHGDWVDIAAPGGDQINYGNEGGVLSTIPGNKYGFMQGTSMACPHVSGVAALVLSKFGNEAYTPDQLRNTLVNSVVGHEFEHNDKYGIGALNASNALADDESIAPDQITDLSAPEISYDQVMLEWTVPNDSDDYQPRFFHVAIGTDPISEKNFSDQWMLDFTNPYEAGKKVSVRVSGFQRLTDYYFAVKSSDQFGNVSLISNVLKVTTTDAPRLKESTRLLSYYIDVREGSTQSQNLGISNIGEGILNWNSFTVNENEFWTNYVEWQEKVGLNNESSTASLKSATTSYSYEIPFENAAQVQEDNFEHWKNDNTVFRGGYTYTSEYGAINAFGSGNPNAGLSHATYFPYEINLTHLEVGLVPMQKEKPLLVEIRKGSDDFKAAEPIYYQEYYPDTTNIFKYFRIPLYSPQYIKEGEGFWVVLHFPKEEPNPLVMQSAPYMEGIFKISVDNGMTYAEAWKIVGNKAPLLTALTTGNDGSFVFVDPMYGNVKANETENVNIKVDATNLKNGKHLATVSIVSNDLNKPGVPVEVQVTVSGQQGEPKFESPYKFEVNLGEENMLNLSVDNIGLDTLNIYGITSAITGFEAGFEDTLTVLPNQTIEVPVVITPPSLGLVQGTAQLVCDDGTFTANLELISKEAPEIVAYFSDTLVTVGSEEEARLDLVIKNTGNGSVLEYDLEHLQLFNLAQGKLPEMLEYDMITSDDAGGPVAGRWEDIEAFGEVSDWRMWYEQRWEAPTNFPYFQRIVGTLFPTSDGQLRVFGQNEEGERTYGMIIGLMSTMNNNIWIRMKQSYHHSFHDREVITIKGELVNAQEKDLGVEYQMVIYRDGTIEYRYKDVNDFITLPDADYVVGFNGPTKKEAVYYRSAEDTVSTIQDGLVIRFTPKENFSFTGVEGIARGTLAAGDSALVPMTVKPALYNVQKGHFNNSIQIANNSADPIVELSITVEVSGQEAFTAADTIDFKDVHVGQSAVAYLKVENTGNNTGNIISVSYDNNDFKVDTLLPLNIEGEAHQMVPVKYTPTSSGQVSSELTLHYNNGTSEKVRLLSQADVDPAYTTIIPENIVFNLNAGETDVVTLDVINANKGIDLEYTFLNSLYASVGNTNAQPGTGTNTDTVTTMYGYTWQESDSLKQFYKWLDLTIESDVDTVFPSITGTQRLVELPFEFPFYGEMFDSIWVSQSGYITVNPPLAENPGYPFVKGDGVKGIIAPFITALAPGGENKGVLMKVESDKVYLQWEEFIGLESNYTGGAITFQLEIHKDGRLFFHYKNIEEWGGLLDYGLESPDETEVLTLERTWIMSWATMGDKETIALTPSTKGHIRNNKSETFTLTGSAENLYRSGTYHDTIWLHTNSQAQPVVDIPVTLNVTGKPVLDIKDSLYWDAVIYTEDTRAEKKLRLYNKGTDVMEISHIKGVDLDKLELYDNAGNKLVKLSSGKLSKKIVVEPWEFVDLNFAVYIEEHADVHGTVEISGNMDQVILPVFAKVVDSPVFSWTATDQKLELNNSKQGEYTFTIQNLGETMLEYNLVPAAASGEEGEFPGEFEGIGNMVYETPSIITSMQRDYKEDGDGVFTPMIIPQPLHFATQYTAPKGGFYLTHIRSFASITSMQEYILVRVYVGGDQPGPGIDGSDWTQKHIGDRGELAYKQKYVIDKRIDKDWVIFPLEEPVFIPEGEDFFLIVQYPAMPSSQGFDTALPEDPDVLNYSWTANHHSWFENDSIPIEQNDSVYHWGKNTSEKLVWKIRPLTASGTAQWFTLDRMSGKLGEQESVLVTANFDANLAGKGDHVAKILVSSNDVNRPNDEVNIELSVNGTPELRVRPNMYKDTLSITEGESAVYNYLFEDPEGESMTFEMFWEERDTISVTAGQTGPETAKVTIGTDYNSAGFYAIPFEISDAAGNITKDSLVIEVKDKNRAPYLNPDYEVIYLNMSDPETFSIDIKDLFIDPDGDELAVVAGNYTPHIVDMALGRYYIDLHPLQQGVGFVVFGADDGKENGFSIFGVYVVIYDDPDAVQTSPAGFGQEEQALLDRQVEMSVYPNPVSNGRANVMFKLEEDANVSVDLYDLNGRKIQMALNTFRTAGIYKEQLDLNNIQAGVYICRFMVNGEMKKTEKIVVK